MHSETRIMENLGERKSRFEQNFLNFNQKNLKVNLRFILSFPPWNITFLKFRYVYATSK